MPSGVSQLVQILLEVRVPVPVIIAVAIIRVLGIEAPCGCDRLSPLTAACIKETTVTTRTTGIRDSDLRDSDSRDGEPPERPQPGILPLPKRFNLAEKTNWRPVRTGF